MNQAALQRLKEDIDHKFQLLDTHTKHLRVLETQAAKFGLHLPPYIQIELDDIRATIQQLTHEIATEQEQLKQDGTRIFVTRISLATLLTIVLLTMIIASVL